MINPRIAQGVCCCNYANWSKCKTNLLGDWIEDALDGFCVKDRHLVSKTKLALLCYGMKTPSPRTGTSSSSSGGSSRLVNKELE